MNMVDESSYLVIEEALRLPSEFLSASDSEEGGEVVRREPVVSLPSPAEVEEVQVHLFWTDTNEVLKISKTVFICERPDVRRAVADRRPLAERDNYRDRL
jgi:hypothetical protein